MNVIVVDDEKIILQTETAMIKNILPEATVASFAGPEEAAAYAAENPVDIAFLDINLEAGGGLGLASRLQARNPEVNIIFCTGYSEYSLEALELYCSAYLMKPITEEKLQKALSMLRYPIPNREKALYARCFGSFEVSFHGEPIRFKYSKTKEMLAYLIDRNGAVLSTREIMAALFDADDKVSYMRNLRADLVNTFRALGVEDVLVQEWGKLGIRKEKLPCDYYDYLDGKKTDFRGEYMTQYSFAEATLARLLQQEDSG